jgi:hypothetical protein
MKITKKSYLLKLTNYCSYSFPENIHQTFHEWGQASITKGKLRACHDHSHVYYKGKIPPLVHLRRIDTAQIQATFASIFLPAQANGDDERKKFLAFWDEALFVSLSLTQFFDKDGNALDSQSIEVGQTYQYDHWILDRLPLIIIQMRPDEKPERFWKPILSLGPRGEDWVEYFLNHWFNFYINALVNKEEFIREWKKMLDFCLTSDAWTENKTPFKHHLSSLWARIIGLSPFRLSFWREEDSLIIKEMESYFAIVAPQILSSAHDAKHFLAWLSDSSAKKIRLQMLDRIAKKALSVSDRWWEEEMAKVVTRYLSLLWSEHEKVLSSDITKKKTFLSLLHRASQTQEPLAIELQSRIAIRN